MRPIAVFVPLPPSYRGGTEEYAYRVARRLAEEWPVRIVTTTVRWTPGPDVLPTGRATLEFLPGRELFQRPVLLSSSARRRIRAIVRGSSLVQVHMPFPLVERWIAREAQVAGVPTVFTYHMDAELGAATGRASGRLVTAMYRSMSARPALRRAGVVVSNSRGYARASPVLAPFDAKVRVIPKGIDLARFGLADASPTGAPSAVGGWPGVDRPLKRVLFVGRLVPYKGLPVLLRAVDQLRRSGVELRLWIAGRGPEETRLRDQVAKSGLTDVVRLLGFVPDVDLAALYRGADVVACPSLSLLESTPTSLEEAVALGVPIVGSSLPGADESLPNDGRRGLLAPPGDIGALAAALRSMLAVPRPGPPPTVRTWEDTASDYRALMAGLMRLGAPPGGAPASTV
jgi:glycosyltransferase involved in cell wall biosynthesis